MEDAGYHKCRLPNAPWTWVGISQIPYLKR
jgi:hypothetical protein